MRRFLCRKCGGTFSWRPPFLAFGRSLAAVSYQRGLKCWCWRKPWSGGTDWYELSLAGRKGFYRILRGRCRELLLRYGLPAAGEQGAPTDFDRHQLWFLLRRLSAPRQLAVQALSLLLARHPGRACYRPDAA